MTTCNNLPSLPKEYYFFENTILSKKDKDKDKGKDRWGVPFAEIIFGWKCLADFGCTPPPLRKKIQNSIWLLPSDRVDYSWQSEADSQRVTFNNSCDFLLTLISPLESLWSPFKGGDLACYVFHAGSFDIKVSISFFLFEQQCDELICFRTNQC